MRTYADLYLLLKYILFQGQAFIVVYLRCVNLFLNFVKVVAHVLHRLVIKVHAGFSDSKLYNNKRKIYFVNSQTRIISYKSD